MAERVTPTGDGDGGGRDYSLLALAGLLLITVVLVDEGLGWWGMLPLVAGVAGVLVPGVIGPGLVLVFILLMLALRHIFLGLRVHDLPPPSAIMDVLLAIATGVYLTAHTRLLTIRRFALPHDVRRERVPQSRRVKGRWLLPREATRRTVPVLPSGEVVGLVVGALAFAVMGYLLWIRLAFEQPPEALVDLPVPAWRALLVAWVGGMALLVGWVTFAYLARVKATPEESLLYLQDQAWAQTRREQRRINSWSAWARLRQERKEQES